MTKWGFSILEEFNHENYWEECVQLHEDVNGIKFLDAGYGPGLGDNIIIATQEQFTQFMDILKAYADEAGWEY